MSSPSLVPPFAVITGAQVAQVLTGSEKQVVNLVEDVYRLHGRGDSVNPPSYFLRFPDRPSSRIIALPASVGGVHPTDGLKWISSFPENVAAGIPRASAVLILNDHATGYPFACLESSIISASRTAASAALAADKLKRGERPRRIGFIGTGLIARYIHHYLEATDWTFDRIGVHDLSQEHAEAFAGYLGGRPGDASVVVHETSEELIRESDLVVLATVAGSPHLHDPAWFAHNPLVLNVSLRDLAPEILLASANILDDVEHCLKADTSPHLTEQLTGGRDFIDGTLFDVLQGRVELPADRPVVFSPFGLGVLDIALGRYVHDQLRDAGRLGVVDGFFHELDRYGRDRGQAAPEPTR
ncbi:2,3-diaminopropionate biosynthesis protein SbnB [Streptomyces sp. NL15-2K]|uniref:2,3-diaminopropionate biosynthesis protein SbnB n=1 Tax=Streptomyces sp. NL15-2K TaxID=376149 RepID=UPI000F576F05|nr:MULTISPECIES: 2,3-diaminopropionate biosynthesis protein SbnB [Actinomycetes]WKX12812.1 2,3-diaminopropionate biosynthesis protein SbnB [Kutzneria buriramensis]GCB45882.1 ornithine cyclodeaminase [Streptomyces sp. NL15-2K]